MNLAMYILVNKDMRTVTGKKINIGKLSGQTGHAVASYMYHQYANPSPEWLNLINAYMVSGQVKIVLSAPQKLLEQLEADGWHSIRDEGRTDLIPDTLTCVNLGIIDRDNIPNNLKFVKKLQLYR